MKKIIPYIIITVLLVVIAICGTYLFMSNKDNNTNENSNHNNNTNDNNENDKVNNSNVVKQEESINLSESELNKYLSYVPTSIDSQVYFKRYINVDNIDELTLLAHNYTKNMTDVLIQKIVLFMKNILKKVWKALIYQVFMRKFHIIQETTLISY